MATARDDDDREPTIEQRDDDDEEEVELFSADSVSPPVSYSSTNSLPNALSEKLTLSPRRCVSKELLDQMPMLSVSTRYHEVSIPKPFTVFHLLQLIEKSIQVGALFSPKLYVPKEIWQQDRVRLAGVALKVEMFQQLKHGLERTSLALPLTADPASARAFENELDAFLELAKAQTDSTALPNSAGAGVVAIGKLTNLAFGFGRMVKKQAIAAVERVGAAQPVAVSFDELEEYAATLSVFFNSTRSIENLLGLSAGADGGQEQVNELKASSSAVARIDPATLDKLKELAVFLDEVVVELVMRDIHSLLEAYLRRVTRYFGEFTVDASMRKVQQSQSQSHTSAPA